MRTEITVRSDQVRFLRSLPMSAITFCQWFYEKASVVLTRLFNMSDYLIKDSLTKHPQKNRLA